MSKGSGSEMRYDFAEAPLFLTLPDGTFAAARLAGGWKTKATSRTEFEVSGLDALLRVPILERRAPIPGQPPWMEVGDIPLRLVKPQIPAHLRALFPFINRGVYEPHERFVRTVFAMEARYNGLSPAKLAPSTVLMSTFGTVRRDGVLLTAGSGLVIAGFLGGTILCCCSPKPPTTPTTPAPAPCTVTLTPADATTTSGLGSLTVNLSVSFTAAATNPAHTFPAGSTTITRVHYATGSPALGWTAYVASGMGTDLLGPAFSLTSTPGGAAATLVGTLTPGVGGLACLPGHLIFVECTTTDSGGETATNSIVITIR